MKPNMKIKNKIYRAMPANAIMVRYLDRRAAGLLHKDYYNMVVAVAVADTVEVVAVAAMVFVAAVGYNRKDYYCFDYFDC